MPKLPTDYSRTVIYKIVCKDATITETYIGNTTCFTNRKHHHKYCCMNEISREHNIKKYTFIRSHGGWDNWTMVEIEKYPCADGNEARTREQYWIDTISTRLNSNASLRDYHSSENIQKKAVMSKNWYDKRTEEYKQKRLERRREYYQENKEKMRKDALDRYYAKK